MRRTLLTLSATLVAAALALRSFGQAAPGGGGEGFDPQSFMQQLQQNMNDSGVTPRDIVGTARQQMQEGTFNVQDFVGQLQGAGVLDENMVGQIGQLRNQMQDRMNQRMQQQGNQNFRTTTTLQVLLNSPDDEWTVLGPKIQRILDLTNDLAATTSNTRYNPNNQQTTGPATAALYSLSTALADAAATDDQIRPKLVAYRAACAKVKTDLEAARADLLTLLTFRQESILLNMQIVE